MSCECGVERDGHDVCERRSSEGRCVRCGNWPRICGHHLPLKERLKRVNVDTSWMPNAGSIGGTMGD